MPLVGIRAGGIRRLISLPRPNQCSNHPLGSRGSHLRKAAEASDSDAPRCNGTTRALALGCGGAPPPPRHERRNDGSDLEAGARNRQAIETAGEFGNRIYLEAWNRDGNGAEKKVVIADQAEWIWNNADRHSPGAIQIVDLFHDGQHLWQVARLILRGDMPRQEQWMLRRQPKLDGGMHSFITVAAPDRYIRKKKGCPKSTPFVASIRFYPGFLTS